MTKWLAKPEGGAFAAVVREVLSNSPAARTKVQRARRVAERYDWQKVTAQFFDTYETFHALRAIPGAHRIGAGTR